MSVAAGNAGQVAADANAPRSLLLGRIHAGGVLAATNLRQELGWIVGGDGISDFSENEMEIWYGPQDRFDVEVRPPVAHGSVRCPWARPSGTPSSPTGPC